MKQLLPNYSGIFAKKDKYYVIAAKDLELSLLDHRNVSSRVDIRKPIVTVFSFHKVNGIEVELFS